MQRNPYKAPLGDDTRQRLQALIAEIGLPRASQRLDVSRETLATAALGQNVTSAIRFKIEMKFKEAAA